MKKFDYSPSTFSAKLEHMDKPIKTFTQVASHVDISEITTTKTIVETGIGPTCSLTVTNEEDQVIDTATVGQILRLTLSVHPNGTFKITRNGFIPANELISKLPTQCVLSRFDATA